MYRQWGWERQCTLMGDGIDCETSTGAGKDRVTSMEAGIDCVPSMGRG